MKVKEIDKLDSNVHELIHKFILQLTSHESTVDSTLIEAIINEDNSHLFFAINDQGEYMGMFAIGFYISPTGKKAWIEDVVVAISYRGQGVGKFLIEFAIQYAKEQNADTLMLTSNPERISANKLYQNLGFQQKTTNVYRMKLKH